MLDFAHLPKPQNGTVDYFPGFSTTGGGQWEVWNKPKNCMFIRILCIGGGAGGGSGFPSATTNARGGGGGGTSGTMSYVTIPAVLLPDRLYVSAGVGGRGGASSTTVGNNGTAGIKSVVCIAPADVAIYRVCNESGSNFGSGGTSGIAGPGGNTFSGAVVSATLQGFQGHFNSFTGSGGATGGAVTGASGGTQGYPTTGILLSGGAGGAGGAGFAGGQVNAPASQSAVYTLFQTLTGGAAGTVGSPTGGNGSDGVELYQPLLATGGSGGGSSFDGTARGGDGGDGGFGCGGGGGGAGGTDGGGAGGNGGPGLVVIHTW